MSTPNDKLRTARESVESSSSPGQPMTRQELADAVNTQVYRLTEKVTAVDANHVGKWERGDIAWPAMHYRQALRYIFDCTTDTELGFIRPQRGCTTGDVNRKTFLRTTVGLGAGVAVARTATAPNSLAADDLAATIAGPTEHYRRMESTVSSEYLAPAAEGHLRLAKRVVHDKLRNSHGFAVLSEIAGLSAWLAADRGDGAAARTRYMESIRFAEKSRNPLLVSYMTASLGHYAVESGDPKQGLQLLNQAARNHDGHTPAAARAWLASLRAVALGAIGDGVSAVEALNEAQRLADRKPSAAQWPWVFAFSSAKVARYQSSALAKLGDLTGSRIAYTAAMATITAPKPQALAKVEHANLLVSFKQVDEACELAVDALQVGKAYGSERIVAGVRALHSKLPATSRRTRELDQMLTELYSGEPS